MMYSGKLPVVFESGGKEYQFHSDFREWIRFESLITNSDVPEIVRDTLALKLVFAGKIPDNMLDAIEFMMWFYGGGQPKKDTDDDKNRNTKSCLETRRVYDFEYDFDYLYAAFLEQYGIDLVDVPYLHWWKFRAMFKGLHDCRLTEIMGYRGADIDNDDMPDSRKAYLLDMQELYELPVSLTERRRIAKARAYFNA